LEFPPVVGAALLAIELAGAAAPAAARATLAHDVTAAMVRGGS
jgi:hypothetical protein